MASIPGDTKFRQDMPPEGGYGRIYVQRTFPRINSRTGKRVALFCLGVTAYGYYVYRAKAARYMRHMVEQNDSRQVLTAFYSAERDRIWLNQLRRMRDDERDLMKGVPGWRVGTFFGEPIYFTLPEDQWWDPVSREVTQHASYGFNQYLIKYRLDVDMRGGPKWYDKYLPSWLERY